MIKEHVYDKCVFQQNNILAYTRFDYYALDIITNFRFELRQSNCKVILLDIFQAIVFDINSIIHFLIWEQINQVTHFRFQILLGRRFFALSKVFLLVGFSSFTCPAFVLRNQKPFHNMPPSYLERNQRGSNEIRQLVTVFFVVKEQKEKLLFKQS